MMNRTMSKHWRQVIQVCLTLTVLTVLIPLLVVLTMTAWLEGGGVMMRRVRK